VHTDEQNEDQNHDQNHDEIIEPVEILEQVGEVSSGEQVPSRKRRVRILAGVVVIILAVAATLVLTVFRSADMAAKIGSVVITNKQVQTSVDEILAQRKGVDTTGMQIPTGSDLTLAELNFHVIAVLLADTGALNKITVTPAEVAQRRAEIISQVGSASALPKALVSANVASQDLDLYIKTLLFDEKLAALIQKVGVQQANIGSALMQGVSDEATKLGIKINPKYGKWDPTQAVVVAPTPSK
jgi:hypothetical protein